VFRSEFENIGGAGVEVLENHSESDPYSLVTCRDETSPPCKGLRTRPGSVQDPKLLITDPDPDPQMENQEFRIWILIGETIQLQIWIQIWILPVKYRLMKKTSHFGNICLFV